MKDHFGLINLGRRRGNACRSTGWYVFPRPSRNDLLSTTIAAFLVFVLTLPMQSPALAQVRSLDKISQPLMIAARDEFIRPSYRNLAAATDRFKDALMTLCEKPSSTRLEMIQRAYADLVSAWGAIEMVRFGPVLGDNILDRFLFYPDRKGRGLKQVQKVLATKDQSVLGAEQLARKSVALQGLGTLDFILSGSGSEQLAVADNPFRCRFALSVAGNLQNMATILDDGWNSDALFVGMWSEPGPQNTVFIDGREAIAHLLSTIVHALEAVREVRLAAFLKNDPAKDRPRSAVLWRSQNTLRLMRANVRSMARFYDVSRLEDALPDDLRQDVSEDIRRQFDSLIRLMDTDQPIAELLSQDAGRKSLMEIGEKLDALILTFYGRYAKAIGLRVGFFFADGD